jgi:chromosome partitioning protein
MKTIVLASQKGGVGKTTLTAHLAIAAQMDGGKAVLTDTDPQGSLATWWNNRETETPDFQETALKDMDKTILALEKAGYDYFFIDTPPVHSSVIKTIFSFADYVLIPTRPSPHDLGAIGQTIDIVTEAGLKFAFVVTQAKTNSRLTLQAIQSLVQFGETSPVVVHDRVDFAGSMIGGGSVLDSDPSGRSADEIRTLWQFIKGRISESANTPKGEKAKQRKGAA